MMLCNTTEVPKYTTTTTSSDNILSLFCLHELLQECVFIKSFSKANVFPQILQ